MKNNKEQGNFPVISVASVLCLNPNTHTAAVTEVAPKRMIRMQVHLFPVAWCLPPDPAAYACIKNAERSAGISYAGGQHRRDRPWYCL
jgi:hypothetical protein